MESSQIFKDMSKNIEKMRRKKFPEKGKMNILNIINKTHYENYNSDIIAYLLDPSNKHYQNDAYLKMFLKKLEKVKFMLTNSTISYNTTMNL